MSVCFCRDRCTSIGRVKVLKSTTGYAETRCRCMYASPPRYRCIREEGHERMHSGSRFDRPSTPARPFTGAPDKLAERRWEKKKDSKREKTSPSLSGYVCIIGKPSILDLYLDNISPSIVSRILNFLFPRISCKEGLLLDKENNKRFAVGDFEDVKSLNRKISFQYILKFIEEFECIACCAFSSIINFQ